MKNLLYTFLILMSCSCASSKKITTLTLEKSPCLGDCVSYSLSFVKESGVTFFVFVSQGKTSSIELPTKIEKEISSEIDALCTEELNSFYGRKGERDLQKIKLQLKGNNIRKCMIEMRSDVSGFYKGFIYCSGLAEAYEIADLCTIAVEKSFGLKLPIVVKRGCSAGR